MRFDGWRRGIIGVALALAALALAGCSVLRVGYGAGPTVAYYWLDGYFDFNGEQSPRVREAIDQWFDWHRRTQLPDYAALLARGQAEFRAPSITPAAMCAWRDEVQQRVDAAVERALPTLAALALTLTPEQLRSFERKMDRDSDKLRGDYAGADGARLALERAVERYENFYGRLDEAQRARLAQLLAAAPPEPERWLAEREQRKRDVAATVRAVQARAATLDAAAAQALALDQVRALAQRMVRSPRPDYRAYQLRFTQAACEQAAAMHATTTAAQREAARAKLKGWEGDLRWIAANGGPDARAAQPAAYRP